MSKRYPKPFDLGKIRPTRLSDRASKVDISALAKTYQKGASFAEFLSSLPEVLAASDLRQIVQRIVQARARGRHFVWAMGAHCIKCGLGPIISDLIRHDVISAVAVTGAVMIHDFEMAYSGKTSEDVGERLQTGEFGMARETAEFLNEAAVKASRAGEGLGRTVGKMILEARLRFASHSVLATCAQTETPATVHIAVGTDIIHMHPSADGAAIGKASHYDFRVFTTLVSELSGGVYFNIGSAVLMPEVFLKAFAIAQNTGKGPTDFITVNIDFIQHYRPTQNVLRRPTASGRGKGYAMTGHFEILIPLIAAAIIEQRG